MNAENRELLTKVINKKLQCALDAESGSEDESKALEQAMKAIDRETAISKNDDSYQEQMTTLEIEREKLENEKLRIKNEQEKIANDNLYRAEDIKLEKEKLKESKNARISVDKNKLKELIGTFGIKAIEIGVIYLVAPKLERRFKQDFAKDCMMWEDEHIFTTTPGRSIKDIFRFK